MKVKEVATVAKAISSPKEDLPTEIVCELKKGRHLDLFNDCRKLVEILEEKSTLLSKLYLLRLAMHHCIKFYKGGTMPIFR